MEDKRSKIKSWLLTVIKDNSWEKYNDLHIDKIDSGFQEKTSWLTGGLGCYIEAVSIVSELNIPYTIELAIPLKSKKTKKDHIVTDFLSLQKEFSDIPPSLYVFRNDWKGLVDLKHKGTVVRGLIDDYNFNGNLYYYQTFHERDNEIRRLLYCV